MEAVPAQAPRPQRRYASRLLILALALGAAWLVPFLLRAGHGVQIHRRLREHRAAGPARCARPDPGQRRPRPGSRRRWASAWPTRWGYGVLGAGAAVFFAAMAAYALARIAFPGRPLWFMLIFSGTIFPFQIYLIPLFQMYARSGLFDTRLGLLLAYIAICIPFPTLVLKNFMAEIPRELDEAATAGRLLAPPDLRLDHPAELRRSADGAVPAAVHLDLERPDLLDGADAGQRSPFGNEHAHGVPGGTTPGPHPISSSLRPCWRACRQSWCSWCCGATSCKGFP